MLDFYTSEPIASLPTAYGEFIVKAYQSEVPYLQPTVAIIKGDPSNRENVLVRFHSECFTGDVLQSRRCDCGYQLKSSLEKISEEGLGVLIYLRQEGRGIGLLNKIRAYHLQDEFGLDTVDANLRLNLPVDSRDYSICKTILDDLHVRSIRLMTNNPDKVHSAEALKIKVVERIDCPFNVSDENYQYLLTKQTKLGHLLDVVKNPK